MKSDIEIARSIKLERIENIAEHYGIPTDELENYGKFIAKVPVKLIDEKKVNKSNLILVTAITPTLAGIGKTTVSVGLLYSEGKEKAVTWMNSTAGSLASSMEMMPEFCWIYSSAAKVFHIALR